MAASPASSISSLATPKIRNGERKIRTRIRGRRLRRRRRRRRRRGGGERGGGGGGKLICVTETLVPCVTRHTKCSTFPQPFSFQTDCKTLWLKKKIGRKSPKNTFPRLSSGSKTALETPFQFPESSKLKAGPDAMFHPSPNPFQPPDRNSEPSQPPRESAKREIGTL